MGFSCLRFLALLSLGLFASAKGQDECKPTLYPAGSFCLQVNSWADFLSYVDDSVPGDELYFCPFVIDKGDQPSIDILWDITIVCAKRFPSDTCTFRGPGVILDIRTTENTFFQGLHFLDGDDHAVHVNSVTGDYITTVQRTFCHCTFEG